MLQLSVGIVVAYHFCCLLYWRDNLRHTAILVKLTNILDRCSLRKQVKPWAEEQSYTGMHFFVVRDLEPSKLW